MIVLNRSNQILGRDAKTVYGRIHVYDKDTTVHSDVFRYNISHELVPAENPIYTDVNGFLEFDVVVGENIYSINVERYIGDYDDPKSDDREESWENANDYYFGQDIENRLITSETVYGITQLKQVDPASSPVTVIGYHNAYDCPARQYIWKSGLSMSEDGGAVIESDIDSTGRWILLTDLNYMPSRYYGVYPSQTTNLTSLFGRLFSAGGINYSKNTYMEGGSYNINDDRNCNSYLIIENNTDLGTGTISCLGVNSTSITSTNGNGNFNFPSDNNIDSIARLSMFKSAEKFVSCNAKIKIIDCDKTAYVTPGTPLYSGLIETIWKNNGGCKLTIKQNSSVTGFATMNFQNDIFETEDGLEINTYTTNFTNCEKISDKKYNVTSTGINYNSCSYDYITEWKDCAKYLQIIEKENRTSDWEIDLKGAVGSSLTITTDNIGTSIRTISIKNGHLDYIYLGRPVAAETSKVRLELENINGFIEIQKSFGPSTYDKLAANNVDSILISHELDFNEIKMNDTHVVNENSSYSIKANTLCTLARCSSDAVIEGIYITATDTSFNNKVIVNMNETSRSTYFKGINCTFNGQTGLHMGGGTVSLCCVNCHFNVNSADQAVMFDGVPDTDGNTLIWNGNTGHCYQTYARVKYVKKSGSSDTTNPWLMTDDLLHVMRLNIFDRSYKNQIVVDFNDPNLSNPPVAAGGSTAGSVNMQPIPYLVPANGKNLSTSINDGLVEIIDKFHDDAEGDEGMFGFRLKFKGPKFMKYGYSINNWSTFTIPSGELSISFDPGVSTTYVIEKIPSIS